MATKQSAKVPKQQPELKSQEYLNNRAGHNTTPAMGIITKSNVNNKIRK